MSALPSSQRRSTTSGSAQRSHQTLTLFGRKRLKETNLATLGLEGVGVRAQIFLRIQPCEDEENPWLGEKKGGEEKPLGAQKEDKS